MTEKKMNYGAAMQKLEDIVEKLENDDLDVDELSRHLQQAQQLIKVCKDKLTKTDAEINKLLSEEN